MMVHGLDEKIAEGEKHESDLDVYFSHYYTIVLASRAAQRNGIDRHFTCKASGAHMSIEYKADSRAATTGNAFIETVSVSTNGALGWAYTSLAQWLLYYIPPNKTIYVVPMASVKYMLPAWVRQYGTGYAPNRTYQTEGLKVSLNEFYKIALDVVKIETGGLIENMKLQTSFTTASKARDILKIELTEKDSPPKQDNLF